MIVKSDQDADVKKYIKKKTIEPIYIQNTSIIK
jgi:ERCC4-related helicase